MFSLIRSLIIAAHANETEKKREFAGDLTVSSAVQIPSAASARYRGISPRTFFNIVIDDLYDFSAISGLIQ
jgi:hypothetical protein